MKKKDIKGIGTILAWLFAVFYDLLLVFSPLAVIRFIFGMMSREATFAALIIGCIFLLFGGLFPKIPDDDKGGDEG